MRTLTAAMLAALAVLVVPSGPADAQNYPWCLAKSESRSCGFVSYEQCMAARSVGGFCEQNFLYHPEAAPRARRRAR